MNCKYHPKPEILIRYASGNLSPAYATAIELHTQFCSGCEAMITEFEAIGGALLQEQRNTSMRMGFDELYEKIESRPTIHDETRNAATSSPSSTKTLNEILAYNRNTPDYSKWKKLTSRISTKSVAISDNTYSSSLIKIKSGAKVPKHTHKGKEITVVLRGAFQDDYGKYSVGDYLVRDESHQHAPHSVVECVCFAITDAPLNYKGFFGPLINLIAARI